VRTPIEAGSSRSQNVEEGFSPPRRLQHERQAQPSAHPGRPGQSHPSVGAGGLPDRVSARPFTTQSRIGVQT
jgi:hypothetical protein